jgi:iron(III) transport system permease protein
MKNNRLKLILWIITAVVLLYGIIFPNVRLIFSSSPTKFVEILAQTSTLESILASLLVSMLSVLLSALIGVPLAFLFDRYEFPFRKIFAALVALPLALPPLVGAVAFIFFYGESGIFGRFVQNLLGLRQSLWTLQGWTPVLLFHAYTMFPFFYLLTSAGLQRIDNGLSEASQSLGANRYQTLWRVTLPQLTPSLIAASLLVFMTSMASFTAPYLFGGSVRVLTLEIFNARQGGEREKAIVLTVILTAISLLSLVFFQRYEGTRRFVAAATKGVSRRREKITNASTKVLTFLLGAVFTFILLAPILTLVLVSFSENASWTTQTLPPRYTTENYANFFDISKPDNFKRGLQYFVRLLLSDRNLAPIINSFLMAGVAALAALVWSFCVVSVTEGRQTWAKRAVSFLNLVPYALPGTALAVAIAETYGQPTWLTGSFVLVGTFWILPFVYFLRFMPLVSRSLQASVEQFDTKLEEAAANLGAGGFLRFWRVRLPLILPGAVAGTLLAFTIGLGEYVASILLYVPNNRPISIAIASEMRDFNLGTAAAYGVVLMTIIAICLLIANRLEKSN